MSPEPTGEHKVLVVAGTYYGLPWLFLECQDCTWRVGFDSKSEFDELTNVAARHAQEDR
jgi:hypothetical protein